MAADLSKPPSVPPTPSAADSRATRPVPKVSEAEIDEMHAAMVKRSRLLFEAPAAPPRKHLPPGFGEKIGQELVDNLNRNVLAKRAPAEK